MVSRKMEDRRSAWKSICVSYAVRCIADRSWSFFLPLYLSRGCGSSLRPTAALSLTQNLAVATLSTGAADLYQSMQAERNNLDAFLRVTIIENVAVVLGGLLLVSFAAEASTDQDLCGTPLRSHVYLLALVCGSIDAICSSLLSTVISKQWVATLFHRTGAAQDDDGEQKADRDGSADLSSANATLSQIDLIVATICPLLVSTVIRYGGGYTTVLSMLVGQHAFGAVLIVASVQRALRLQPQLGIASTKKNHERQACGWPTLHLSGHGGAPQGQNGHGRLCPPLLHRLVTRLHAQRVAQQHPATKPRHRFGTSHCLVWIHLQPVWRPRHPRNASPHQVVWNLQGWQPLAVCPSCVCGVRGRHLCVCFAIQRNALGVGLSLSPGHIEGRPVGV